MIKRLYLAPETPAGYSHVFQTWTALNSTDLGSMTHMSDMFCNHTHIAYNHISV